MSEWVTEKSDFSKFGTRNFHNSGSRSSPGLILWLFILTCDRETFWKRQKDLVYRYFTKIAFSNLKKSLFFENKQRSVLRPVALRAALTLKNHGFLKINTDSTRIRRGLDADWTRIGRRLDADWTQIERGLDVDWTRTRMGYALWHGALS